MSKEETQLWDDSALLNAFDNAITKYKKMHRGEKNSTQEENVATATTQISSHILQGNPQSSADAGDANDPLLLQENHQTDSHAPEPHAQTSNGPDMQDVLDGYTNSQGVDEYQHLLKQYYELEEQRQKVLQQLQQAGYWNNQYTGEGSGPSGQWGTCSTQEHQDSNQQASCPTVVSYCCPYVCPCLEAPCSSMPACSIGGTCTTKVDIASIPIACTKGPGKLSSLEDDSIAKTAMGAAEKAISSMKLNASGSSNIHEGSSEGKLAQSISPETDLTVVLNAWYSAGFYTGKYLSEQSISKGRRE